MKKKVLFAVGVIVTVISVIYLSTKGSQSILESLTKQDNQIAMYIENDDGEYQVNNTKEFPTEGYVLNTQKSTCKNGSVVSQNKSTKKIKIKVINSDICSLYFDKEVFSVPKAVNSILNNKSVAGVNSGNPNFADVATTDEGVYAMADDYGTSYYYRGAVTNNYVNFANKWWRIIRVNGDGSIRMIYDGTQAYANGTSNSARNALTSIAFNTSYNDAKYVGYMYGPSGTTASTTYAQATTNTVSSNIKTQVDNWYKTNIVDAGYSQYVSDEIFCNDRSISGTPKQWWTDEGTNIGYGTNSTAYGAFSRFLTQNSSWSSTPAPKFTCKNKNDSFTVSDTSKGNGALTYPVGLITVDEIVTAGSGKYGISNSSYYLYKGSWYWLLSPRNYNNYSGAYSFAVSISGDMNYNRVASTGAVAPVINLSPEYSATLKGTGTMTDPYVLS